MNSEILKPFIAKVDSSMKWSVFKEINNYLLYSLACGADF
jgi:hypothetical protein